MMPMYIVILVRASGLAGSAGIFCNWPPTSMFNHLTGKCTDAGRYPCWPAATSAFKRSARHERRVTQIVVQCVPNQGSLRHLRCGQGFPSVLTISRWNSDARDDSYWTWAHSGSHVGQKGGRSRLNEI
ncbi:hypothetical protein BJ170DRAFT_378346 [Xylariales sp. AK1849]|nr:hypothetical protein BJ170DRAFT_378346 [Xylariales sp. AK1849]